ncbi:Uncharacterised protein [Vibrio cholerae]|uniref:Uncharacterized protein n=1 Tax=Vibrio cholerae TaxID=666 RepID=A0A655VW83_VIBCL|nr:Uncharacterised protein [Vibrio cholerae]CSB75930.1 Uncharacterised protein [Vibrio cholerae]CSB83542.1 Uncharacterised protein [Vibrio cholerae]CSC02607.1 Uncharacterised protein [Vibrio cholerae]CSD04372.1 Uncharacterised protein [Vibrio cholerae]
MKLIIDKSADHFAAFCHLGRFIGQSEIMKVQRQLGGVNQFAERGDIVVFCTKKNDVEHSNSCLLEYLAYRYTH